MFKPIFSLILGTLNRPNAIKSCLSSIINQTYDNYELIIIDQSDNDNTRHEIENVKDARIIYKHVNFTGLSRARNYGLRMAKGQYFCLLDDDAYYDEKYLLNALNYIDSKRILSGYIFDTVSNRDFVNYNYSYDKKNVNLRMIMRLCPSAGLIFPMSVVRDVGYFDEDFGVGSLYGSGEETDLILRTLKYGYKVMFVSELKLKHPVPIPVGTEDKVAIFKKRASYYEGTGALYKKNMNILGNKRLIFTYLEIMFKFYIKCLVLKGEEREFAKEQYNAFLRGYKMYKMK